MTAIIGYKDKIGNVFLGADSAAVGVNLIIPVKTSKIIIYENLYTEEKEIDLAIAYAGSFFIGNILERWKMNISNMPKIQKDKDMIEVFIPALKDWLCANDYTKSKLKGGLIVATRKEFYYIDEDFHVHQPYYDYTAGGVSENIAYGALGGLYDLHQQDRIDGKELGIKALQIIDRHSPDVCRPLILYNITRKIRTEI